MEGTHSTNCVLIDWGGREWRNNWSTWVSAGVFEINRASTEYCLRQSHLVNRCLYMGALNRCLNTKHGGRRTLEEGQRFPPGTNIFQVEGTALL